MARPKREFRTASKDNYHLFCERNPEIHITFEQYKKVLYTYNTILVNHALETGEKIKFPYGLGVLVINKYKPKRYCKNLNGEEVVNLPVDWVESKKQGKKVYLLNAHTEGYKYYWMWSHSKAKIKNAYIWKFEMSREHSRMLTTYLKMPNSKYKFLYKQYPRTR